MCPNCGSVEYRSARTDETPFALARGHVRELCFFGEAIIARDLLMNWATVRIDNLLGHRWVCSSCGAKFDD